MTRLLGTMLLLVAACAAEVDEDYGGLAGPLTAKPDEWMPPIGLQTHVTLPREQLDTLPPSHVLTTRVTFAFRPDTVEDDGTIRTWYFDPQVIAHAERGIVVLPMLMGDGPVAKRELRKWQSFASSLAARYAPGGSFWTEHPELPYLPIRAWEIWNEPNLVTFWGTPRPNPVRYRRMLRRAFIGLRTVDPRARVVFGGMAFPGNMDDSGNVGWRDFMDKVFDGRSPAQRTRNRCLVDAVAIHPYDNTIGGSMDRIRAVYDFLERRDMTGRNRERRDVQIWITELGWAVPVEGAWPREGVRPWNTVDSEEQQAVRVRRAVEELGQRRGHLRIGPLYWYTFEDIVDVHDVEAVNDGKWPDWAGLWTHWPRNADGSVGPARARPAWHALGDEARRLDVLRLPPVRCTLGEVVKRRDQSLRLLESDDADDDLIDEETTGGSCSAPSCTDDTGRDICAGDRGVLACAGGTQVCTCDGDGGFSACSSCISP